MIRAKGKKNGRNITVYYENKIFLFNNEENIEYEEQIKREMKRKHAIGGTFYAENDYDVLNIINVLRNHFFDKPTLDILVKNEHFEELPYEDDVIY